MKTKGQLFVISAPSGAGKTTLSNMLLQEFPNLGYSISYTTRPPRPGEKNGIHYNFVSGDIFQSMAESGEFLEYATVHGNMYGTSREAVEAMLADGKDVLFDIDVQGAMQLKEKTEYGVYIFLAPPSLGELQRRLTGRGDTDGQIPVRMSNADWEIDYIPRYDYLVINNSLNDAYIKLAAIYTAEKCRIAQLADSSSVIASIKRL